MFYVCAMVSCWLLDVTTQSLEIVLKYHARYYHILIPNKSVTQNGNDNAFPLQSTGVGLTVISFFNAQGYKLINYYDNTTVDVIEQIAYRFVLMQINHLSYLYVR